MRILAVSDIHGNFDIYRWIGEVAKDRRVDAVVLAGDLLGHVLGLETVEDSQRADAERVVAILRTYTAPVLYVMGNDDLVELDPQDERITSLHGRRVEASGFSFVGYQYTLPFMGGTFERSEEQMAADLAALEHLLDERTVMVTHGPAQGILDGNDLGPPAGSSSLRATLERSRARAHVHGHVHHRFGREGNHFNVAAWREKRAMMIDLDTMAHEVVKGGS